MIIDYLWVTIEAMQTLQFTTDVDCHECVQHLGLYLNALPQIQGWQLNLSLPETILTIYNQGLLPKQMVELMQQAGFRSQFISQ